MNIRDGVGSDIEACIILTENFHVVSGYADLIPFCAKTSRKYFQLILDGMGSFSVAETDGKVVGFIAGLFTPSVVNEKYLVGTELAWWMEPDYRKGSAGIKLLKHLEDKAKEAGCILWSMMCLESQTPDKLEKLYLNRGYKGSERTFTKLFKENISWH